MLKSLEKVISEMEVHTIGKPFNENVSVNVQQMKKWCDELKEIAKNKENMEDDGK